MNLDLMHVRLRELKPLFLPGSDGSLKVLNKSARIMCEFTAESLIDEEDAVNKIERALSEPFSPHQVEPIWLRINVISEAVPLDDICHFLIMLDESFKSNSSIQLVLHFANAPKEWDSILSAVRFLRDTFGERRVIGIQAIGPLSSISDSEMEQLGNLGVRIAFASGGIKNCDTKNIDARALRSFSRFGFRCPVIWYVHVNNIAVIEEQLPDVLTRNYYSGFALPLVSCSPFYRFDEGFPALPDAKEYCQLLVNSYRKYPYYDDVLLPLNELAMLIRHGGWHSEFGIPSAVQMLVSSSGRVGLYRQTPALAIPWTDVTEVVTKGPAWVRQSFLECAAEVGKWQKGTYCCECSWQYACGGLDMPDSQPINNASMDCMCRYRKLFLEHFARLRVPDVVFTKTNSVQ